MKKTTNWQLIQKYKYYSTKELAAVFGYHTSAIKYWIKIGLKPINPEKRRFLFYGADVIKFLKEKKMKYKMKLKPDECYCASCKKGRKIVSGTLAIEYTNIILGKGTVKQVIIRGKCVKCRHMMVRLSSTAIIDDFLKHYPSFRKETEDKVNS